MTQTNSPNPGQGDSSTAIATTFWVNGVAAGISAAVTAETARAEAAETTVAATAASAASAAATAATAAATASSAVTTLTATVASDFAAALVSPAFTGTPTAPTAAASTNTTQIATTAFVEAAIASIAPGFQTLVDSASIAWNIGGLSIAAATLTLGASGRHLTITGFVAGGQYSLFLVQGSGGNGTITTYTNAKFGGSTLPTLSTGGGNIDVLSFVSDGSFVYGILDGNKFA